MKRYAAYLFDLYGTLVDIHTDEDRPGFWKALCGVFADLGGSDIPGANELQRRYLALVRAEEALLTRTAGEDACVEIELRRVFSHLLSEMKIDPSDAVVDRLAVRFRALSTTHIRAYAGASSLLDDLRARGSRVILLSNAQSCFTLPELRSLSLEQRFDRIFISSDVGFKKPDARFFRAALDAEGLRPEDCLMIGNDPKCDVLGAAAAGIDAFYIRSALTPRSLQVEQTLPVVGSLPSMDLRVLRRILVHTA